MRVICFYWKHTPAKAVTRLTLTQILSLQQETTDKAVLFSSLWLGREAHYRSDDQESQTQNRNDIKNLTQKQNSDQESWTQNQNDIKKSQTQKQNHDQESQTQNIVFSLLCWLWGAFIVAMEKHCAKLTCMYLYVYIYICTDKRMWHIRVKPALQCTSLVNFCL